MSRIPLLTTDGDAHARGLAHGRRFAREIADNVETYLRRFAASGLDRDEAFVEAERWRSAIAAQNPSYGEEMRGIAEGSSQSEATIALLNARYELAFTLFGQEAKQAARQAAPQGAIEGALTEVGPDGCTTFGLLPDVTADRHTWLGQNWDWLAGVHGRTFVLRARRKDRPSFVCLTEAGIAGGKMGVNECGIGLVENGLASSHEGRNPYQKPFHVRCQFRDRRGGRRDRRSRGEPRPRQPPRARGRHHHPFQPFPGGGARRVAARENCPQHALPRRSHAAPAGHRSRGAYLRPHARGGERPFRRALRDLPPSRSGPARGAAHHDGGRGAHRSRGAHHARGRRPALHERIRGVPGVMLPSFREADGL